MSKTATKIPLRGALLGENLPILRAFPSRALRTVGAWCFLDHLGPVNIVNGKGGMDVGPHPHIGLQTFTWLIEGEVLHKDSLGYSQIISPKQINLMTAGKGIVHTEETLSDSNGLLHCAQLWIALPKEKKAMEPDFKHYPNIPLIHDQRLDIHILVGEFLGHQSPVLVHTPLMAADLYAESSVDTSFPLNPEFEYGLLVLKGAIAANGESVTKETFLYIEPNHEQIKIEFSDDSRILLIGGKPFKEPLIVWWNFVARTNEEIIEAREDWVNGDQRFGEVSAYKGARMAAPELSGCLKPS